MSITLPSFYMLHLGLGSFHRAHQAVYLHRLLVLGDKAWTIIGGHLRPDMKETESALMAQGGKYLLETISPQNEHRYEEITSITEVIPYEPGIVALAAKAANPNTRIISFTVTEAGYYLDAKDRLELHAPDIAQDFINVKAGKAGSTIYGALAVMLKARQEAKAGGVTLLCCDNLRHNGERSRSGLLQFLKALGDTELFAWVEKNTTSPNAMVDRITPRPTHAVIARVKAATGKEDKAALMSESFIQWVMEENFMAGRPEWEKVGVEMVASVAAHEEAKIRLLNAAHSCLAWAGTLIGYQYIHEDVQNPAIYQMAYDYMTEDVIPVLSPSPLPLENYRDLVLERFGNPAIGDTNQRVAMDGFSKIPGFIVPTMKERLARGESIAKVACLPALFLAYLERWHRGEIPYEYQDQAMDSQAAHAICESTDPLAAFCANAVLFGDLASDLRLEKSVRHAYEQVRAFIAIS